jgi:Asp-tRNA(Asn)/Glu-tRNA(Gln) amidotransferase A subunit family amidase
MHTNAHIPLQATLTELGPLLADGSLSAAGLLARCRAQIAAHDRAGAGLAALIGACAEAEEDARRLDAELGSGGGRGPLHGIPLILKDNIDLQGYPTTSGNRALAGAMARADAEQTRRLRDAGGIIIAKGNMSEFSFEIRSRSSLGGDVRNPFDPSVTAGGSSGGTAAAVAAGFAVAGLGTDTGGSIRVPASFNGLVGLRPTRGLIDMRGVAPLAPSTDTIGPIARCVADAATLFGIMTDASRGPMATSPREAMANAPTGAVGSPRGLHEARIGVLRQAFGADPDICHAMESALTTMASAGAVLIDPVALPAGLLPIGRPLAVDWEFAAAFDAYLRDNFAPGTAPGSLAEIYDAGAYLADYRETLGKRLHLNPLTSPGYREVLAYHRILRDALAELMVRDHLTAIVYPTSMVLPSSLDNPAIGWAPELAACSGWPAVSLPAGRSAHGLPIGLEFLGHPHSERALLALAQDLEAQGPGRFVPDLLSAVRSAGAFPAASAR